MGKIVDDLVDYLIKKKVIVEEQKCIYQYGLQIGIEVLLNTIISIFIAISCNMVKETIVFFVVFTLLRSYAGGLHLDTYFSCLICSCTSLFGLLFIVKKIYIDKFFSFMVIGVMLFIIKVLSPVQDINRPINLDDIKRFDKKLNNSILGILIVSSILFIIDMNKILMMISVTTIFMVLILILGKIKYVRAIKKKAKDDKSS